MKILYISYKIEHNLDLVSLASARIIAGPKLSDSS